MNRDNALPPAIGGDRTVEDQDRARILIVDDDERNLLALRTVLEDIADVVLARSGTEALRHLLREEYAVILLDVFMPGMDGYETAQLIRAREQTRRIPIIFLSAVNKEAEHLLRGYAMGAVDYVFKPVEPVVLRSKATVFVDLYQANREVRRKADQEQALLDATLRANAERLRAEQKLRIAEQRQAAIIQSLPIILYLEACDAEARVLKFASGNFQALTGFPFDEIASAPSMWQERLHPEDHDRVVQAIQARGSGRPFAIEYRWQCADGQYRHFLDQAVLLHDRAGEPVEYAGTLLDITERRDLESQLLHVRKMDALGQLTGGIAHDFNNMLAAMLGGLGLLEKKLPLDNDQRRIMDMTRHAAEQGAELVARLLAFARRQKLEPARIDVARLAEGVTQLLGHTLGGLVTVEWNVPADLWPPFADESQLELALMNLAINARDAMPEGGTVGVHCRNARLGHTNAGELEPGDYIVLAVSDTGCGIAPELLQRVTEPFFTTKAVGKGTGLGLSMVYGFAQQSGGTMRLRSRVGEGTTAEIWLPRAPQASAGVHPRIRAPEPVGPSMPSRRILLVDDHAGVRATTAQMLEEMGHQVTTAADGEEALSLPTSRLLSIDLVVSDYAMPHMSGIEVIRALREVRPGLPALVITGYADSREVAGASQGIPMLGKPFTPGQLQAGIALALAPARQAAPPRHADTPVS